ncbi:YbhB/YbcL family Raf kinase inhibitor-like protein [Mitsuaria sp. 7]|uniref:YbhB/YbcL family Raf kinase inhibitor-like protein n=1 Tax=Mitsuaria sp. 7 TaxID=1658665 RepID=UPI00082C5A48|nr:YbhB/YbcL family Raf kinase inhibitor-like protein [Mitsuaria sp. 7]
MPIPEFDLFRSPSNQPAGPSRRLRPRHAATWLLPLLISACGSDDDAIGAPADAGFSVSSTSLIDGAMQQAQYSSRCAGHDRSPQLSWRNVPVGTQSLAVTVHDRDAPTGSGFWHAVVADLPPALNGLDEGALQPASGAPFRNDAGVAGYSGACPPEGQIHRYDITVYALKVPKLATMLPPDASPALVGLVIAGNSLGKATLTALAGRGTLGSGPDEPKPTGFVLTSGDASGGKFGNAQFAPAAAGLGCDGGNLSPRLAWSGAPAGTRSYAITMLDLDAPTGSGFWHWVMADLPASVQSLATNAAATPPAGALAVRNDAGVTGYGGICPPSGSSHRYELTVHAIAVENLAQMLPPQPSPALVGFVIRGNSLGKATLTVTGSR